MTVGALRLAREGNMSCYPVPSCGVAILSQMIYCRRCISRSGATTVDNIRVRLAYHGLNYRHEVHASYFYNVLHLDPLIRSRPNFVWRRSLPLTTPHVHHTHSTIPRQHSRHSHQRRPSSINFDQNPSYLVRADSSLPSSRRSPLYRVPSRSPTGRGRSPHT